MRLDMWLKRNKIWAKDFAPQIGVDGSTLSCWVHKGSIPNKATMRAIYVATAGQVEPNDFYDLPDLSEPSARADAPEAAA